MPSSDQHVDHQRYSVIPRVIIFIFHEDKVLLIKGSPSKKIWAGHYNGIGGHVERGEDILDAAKRELYEEAGISNCKMWLCGVVLVDVNKEKGVCLFVFKGLDSNSKVKASKEGELKWVDKNSIDTIPTVEDLPKLLLKVDQQKRGDAPFYARSLYDSQGILEIVFNS
jgi:8-oxo-dGTP diphosphatase